MKTLTEAQKILIQIEADKDFEENKSFLGAMVVAVMAIAFLGCAGATFGWIGWLRVLVGIGLSALVLVMIPIAALYWASWKTAQREVLARLEQTMDD